MHGIIQIAGIQDQAEADILLKEGVDWLGFPLRLPVHKEDLSDQAAQAIVRGIRSPHRGVLITYLKRAEDVLDLCEFLGVETVQLHGEVEIEDLVEIKIRRPEILIIKSLVVSMDNALPLEKTVLDLTPYVDIFITDTFDPQTGASGATGKTHDWRVSRRLVELSSRPVILAGGLNPSNVAEAIRQVRPAGVDAHTGVEGPDGRKSQKLVRSFVAEARKALAEIQ